MEAVNRGVGPADITLVRARGLGSLMALAVSGVLGVVTMRACQPSSPAAPSNPVNVANDAVAALCANRQAVDDAGGTHDIQPAVTLPPGPAAQLGKVDPAIAGLMANAAACPAAPAPVPGR